jgi:hypothetical protein
MMLLPRLAVLPAVQILEYCTTRRQPVRIISFLKRHVELNIQESIMLINRYKSADHAATDAGVKNSLCLFLFSSRSIRVL